ncbi:MAG: MFS transporter [Chthonomonadaceae bacterium]|nr:MFS transporter [Chthonomonadaceae bacterium]
MTGYQWLVLFAAWLGWGFDIFDGLLFNYVASNCVPTLLHVPIGTPRATQLTLQWVGITASILLLGWALGGTLFGKVADKVGRTKTLLLTMLLYSIGTAACAFAPNLPFLIFCRFIASLGIGGEWAAGAAMVAEVVPEKRRVEAGALLYTSAPVGLFLATFVNLQISGKWLKDSPETSWRYVFLCGLIPAAVAFILRLFVKEPERWKAAKGLPPRIAELFTPQLRKSTLSGFLMALTALLTWWSVSNFIPTIAGGLAKGRAVLTHLDKSGTAALVEGWKAWATNAFNLGGLIGTLLTVPASKFLGRRAMFGIYFFLSAIALFAAFRLDLTDEARLMMYFPIGLTVFGVFGSFTYYLPELFPTRLRGTGAGFCYNVGRVITAAGPLLIVSAATSISPVLSAMNALFYVGFVPLIGLCLLPLVVETKGRVLED